MPPAMGTPAGEAACVPTRLPAAAAEGRFGGGAGGGGLVAGRHLLQRPPGFWLAAAAEPPGGGRAHGRGRVPRRAQQRTQRPTSLGEGRRRFGADQRALIAERRLEGRGRARSA